MSGKSLRHFLGRFRRANDLTPGGLANAAGFGTTIIARWEKFRFNPPPSPSQLAAVAVVAVGVSVVLQPLVRCESGRNIQINGFDRSFEEIFYPW